MNARFQAARMAIARGVETLRWWRAGFAISDPQPLDLDAETDCGQDPFAELDLADGEQRSSND